MEEVKLDMLSWLKGQKGRKTREQVSATLEEKHREKLHGGEKKDGKENKKNKTTKVMLLLLKVHIRGVLGLWRAMQAVMRRCSQLLGTQPKISNDSRLTL